MKFKNLLIESAPFLASLAGAIGMFVAYKNGNEHSYISCVLLSSASSLSLSVYAKDRHEIE